MTILLPQMLAMTVRLKKWQEVVIIIVATVVFLLGRKLLENLMPNAMNATRNLIAGAVAVVLCVAVTLLLS